MAEMQFRQIVHAVAVQATFEHVGEQHSIVDGRHLDAVMGKYLGIVFHVVADF
jgi:hypothetical protein